MIKDCQYYLDTFQVSEGQLEQLCAIAQGSYGDYSDLYFENTEMRTLSLRDSVVSSGGYHVDYGAGIRCVQNEHTGYAHSESTDFVSLKDAAAAAGSIAIPVQREDSPSRGKSAGRPNPAADRYPIGIEYDEAAVRASIPFLEKLEKLIRAKDSRTLKVLANITSKRSDLLMYNSLSELRYETRPILNVSVSAIFRQGSQSVSAGASRSFSCGAEMLTDELLETLAAITVKGLDERFEARRPKGGRMSVVMGAGASGILLHEAMGHAFEADFIRKGQSIFGGRIGERVAPEGVTIVDDGTIHGNRGALNFDDEGVSGQRTCMVEDGILTSYLHDRISARHFGVRPTGNGRRESFRYSPLPRMRATYMEGGRAKAEDIIASVREGIYVDSFSNGQVNIGEGDFTFYVKSGFLIEDGRLTMPVKDVNVIGNGPRAMTDIRAVGNDPLVDDSTWTCGKGQSVPVSCGMPTVLIDNLTVGGE